ncbi:protein-disulfide reductase DsbD domain-containing protein [Phaeobacter sp.]|uniref:protein-disulfide reductase DsbD domain-containing protein n=1 Tax=Phaeobacter sp. TaxID=1902409 RepID=UPI0025EA257A|nr:protein-disulfide reductase DsbD domain-containing protein [Phaeobacter sp.]
MVSFAASHTASALASRLIAGLCAVASAAMITPQASQAQSMDDIVQIEILDGGSTRNGSHLSALKITLAPGWKTYWRAPGDAGIPPRFEWAGSQNLVDIAMTWPTPDVFLTSGYRTIGYHNQLILPIEITPQQRGSAIQLKGRMELGICKDVCIPSDLQFEAQLNPDSKRHPAIVAALADQPLSAAEAGVSAAQCALRPSRYGMSLTVEITMPSAGGEETVIIEPGVAHLVTTETTTVRKGRRLVAETEIVSADGGVFAVDRSQMRFTVLGQNHAVDIRGCSRL